MLAVPWYGIFDFCISILMCVIKIKKASRSTCEDNSRTYVRYIMKSEKRNDLRSNTCTTIQEEDFVFPIVMPSSDLF
jgi:hypothetical protein